MLLIGGDRVWKTDLVKLKLQKTLQLYVCTSFYSFLPNGLKDISINISATLTHGGTKSIESPTANLSRLKLQTSSISVPVFTTIYQAVWTLLV